MYFIISIITSVIPIFLSIGERDEESYYFAMNHAAAYRPRYSLYLINVTRKIRIVL